MSRSVSLCLSISLPISISSISVPISIPTSHESPVVPIDSLGPILLNNEHRCYKSCRTLFCLLRPLSLAFSTPNSRIMGLKPSILKPQLVCFEAYNRPSQKYWQTLNLPKQNLNNKHTTPDLVSLNHGLEHLRKIQPKQGTRRHSPWSSVRSVAEDFSLVQGLGKNWVGFLERSCLLQLGSATCLYLVTIP